DQRFALALYWSFWKSLSQKLRDTTECLARFPEFSHGGGSPREEAEPEAKGDAIRVGITAKRDLFREQKLSPLEINFLASLSQEKRVAPGEVLFREGDEGDALYVVLDGRVMISKNIAGAGDEALEFVERGGYFGEMALIDNQPRSADVKADEKGAVVLAIPRKVLEG
ncbi:MAG: cyclic nucleotide-binding domain-containing protein, partial [bacterium]|nr:cyclic nucleotide-binding domain-containing protein [bacterium]